MEETLVTVLKVVMLHVMAGAAVEIFGELVPMARVKSLPQPTERTSEEE